jgi:hypothetical protein
VYRELAADNSIWRITSWHKNMRQMQVGGKFDESFAFVSGEWASIYTSDQNAASDEFFVQSAS